MICTGSPAPFTALSLGAGSVLRILLSRYLHSKLRRSNRKPGAIANLECAMWI